MQDTASEDRRVWQHLKSAKIYNYLGVFFFSQWTVRLTSFFFATLIWFKVDMIDLLFITASVPLASQTVKVMASVGSSTVAQDIYHGARFLGGGTWHAGCICAASPVALVPFSEPAPWGSQQSGHSHSPNTHAAHECFSVWKSKKYKAYLLLRLPLLCQLEFP